MDPFAPLKLIGMALKFWLQKMGPKWLFGLMGASTLAVLILGCHETYS